MRPIPGLPSRLANRRRCRFASGIPRHRPIGDEVNRRAYAKMRLRSVLHRVGVDLVRYVDEADLRLRRFQLVDSYGINLLLDVGASSGQYAQTMRSLGYSGRIVSFEPLSEAFAILSRSASYDPLWEAVQVAVGQSEGEALLHVSGNSQSSSLLPMLPAHIRAAPDSKYVRDERVTVTSLGTTLGRYAEPPDRVMVKLDTQGFEGRILSGAGVQLERVAVLQLEMSLVPLYEGQELIEDAVASLRKLRFIPVFLEPTFSDPATGAILQVDGLFARESSHA